MTRTIAGIDEMKTESSSLPAMGEDILFLLARANARSLTGANSVLRDHDLNARSYSVLALAASEMRASQRDIAEYLLLGPSQVVALVDELENRELVSRETDPHDRRTNVVVVTTRGRELFTKAAASTRKTERELHEGLSESEWEYLAAILRRIAFSRTELASLSQPPD